MRQRHLVSIIAGLMALGFTTVRAEENPPPAPPMCPPGYAPAQPQYQAPQQQYQAPQQYEAPQQYNEQYQAPQPQVRRQRPSFSPYQVAVSAGGGIGNFFGRKRLGDVDTGAAWDARIAIGTRFPIGLEAAYVGGYNE